MMMMIMRRMMMMIIRRMMMSMIMTMRRMMMMPVQVSVSEEFLEHCSEGALSVEVYGHRSSGAAFAWQVEPSTIEALIVS